MGKYDAIVVGSGPNGLAAGITLQRSGLSTLIIEGSDSIGGGLRTKELTLNGFKHDVCSAIHPMAIASPFFKSLPLMDYGLEFTHATYPLSHPMDNNPTVTLYDDLKKTIDCLEGKDGQNFGRLVEKIIDHWEDYAEAILAPLTFRSNFLKYSGFGLDAIQPATWTAKRFSNLRTKALWAGLAAHSIQPLSNFGTSAIAIILSAIASKSGWPIPVGGSKSIADAMVNYFKHLGGEIQTDIWIEDVNDLPNHKLLFLDLTPRQILRIKGLNFSIGYQSRLKNFRYGMGIFKMDWALSEKTPFKDNSCNQSATVHLGNTFEEIVANEYNTFRGKKVEKPFVLFSQQSTFDKTRAPADRHIGWAYCHVPHGSEIDYSEEIENQIERFAPGFKDTILARHIMRPKELEEYNPNYVGGDINGGIMDLRQLVARPVLGSKPYRTSLKNVYICSSSTPPGGGVHGMCGFHAAICALQDHLGFE
ncbi:MULTISPECIES: phytoene desaturase family protein [Sphingobacterium]|uniref:Protein p49 n=1 Tax=Sphingobacterium multivorum TaxID=28454 RepID=A0A653XKQ2_SPHMU|nr:NAD(P)/FAD-dependent oxidoreductase [Sphingobacterium multivorum]VXC30635.1 Protein p49 [Sphingobacterium multivorum]